MGRLETSVALDRETTPSLTFQLVCSIAGDQRSADEAPALVELAQSVTLTVSDEDDSAPALQSPDEHQFIDVYLEDEGIAKVLFTVPFIYSI